MHFETDLVQFDPAPGDPFRPTSTPIYQTATFRLPEEGDAEFDYSRSGNPTRRVLEDQLARLERGRVGLAFTSGMAAISTLASLVPAGQSILAGLDLYGGTYRFLSRVLARQGVRVDYVDTTDLEAVGRALARGPRLLLLETPSNPRLRVSDLSALAALAQSADCRLAVDNSLMSPYLQRPLEHGCDLVVHSATKYLSGHGDVTAGVVVARDPDLGERLAFHQNAAGTALGPQDAWLLLRGLKTLAIRLDRQQATAQHLADLLAGRSALESVHYPSLKGHPGWEIHRRQARGGGAVITLETGSVARSRRLLRGLSLFATTVSFGGIASSASLPAAMSHASIPERVRRERGLPDDLIRLSVGIEHPEDLERDLLQGLDSLGRTAVVAGGGR